MEAGRHEAGGGGEGTSRALQDLKRAARVLGYSEAEFARILIEARSAAPRDQGEQQLVEQVKKHLARVFQTR